MIAETFPFRSASRAPFAGVLVLAWLACGSAVQANPVGGTVSQGAASITTSGSQLTVNQSTPFAYINWQSFNINQGEITTFVQPSSSSVAWNRIYDPNNLSPSQILGNLNANGYVVLQNQSGFYIGGQAVINAHGLVMTTAATPSLNISGGGPWEFDAPPPSASIKNYGQVNIVGGGSVFLIASDIENEPGGTISTPGGNIGLYDGQKVLVSMAPDGRGLSAEVTLPAGSVNNQGDLIADAGSIAAQAQTVNQGGLIQANSVQNVNGAIELVAGDSVTLDASSVISAQGGATGTSSGGSISIQSGNTFSDAAGSAINIGGGAQGGNGGQAQISAPQMSSILSSINGAANAGYLDSSISFDTANIFLNSDGSLVPGALALNVSSLSAGFSQINLQASCNIELNAPLDLTPKAGMPASVALSAENTITLDQGSGIEAQAGQITLTAPTVNQDGVLQANSSGNLNGLIEILAGGSLTVGADSVLSAVGDSTVASQGGFVVLQSGGSYADTATSQIKVAGNGGAQDGIVEILGPGLTSGNIQSSISENYAYLVNPFDITFYNPNPNPNDNNTDGATPSPGPNTTIFNVNNLSPYSKLAFFANDNITLSADSYWNVPDNQDPMASLTLEAVRNITLNNGSDIAAANLGSLNLTAGTELTSASGRTSGKDGIYLDGSAYLQAQQGDINAIAGNEVQVGWSGSSPAHGANSGTGGITTTAGGNVTVTATYGDVNAGSSISGYKFKPTSYSVSPTLGGISTAAGGNVTISAGGNITSYLPSDNNGNLTDAGSGAFGPEPGNVTINAGENVYGHYVLANGNGAVTAQNGDVGISDYTDYAVDDFALSLVKDDWTVNAPNGSIYLQEVRNPNGVFNTSGSLAQLFDYDPNASVSLNAGDYVEITGADIPRSANAQVGLIFPSSLYVDSGAGGFQLDQNVTLFQSPNANLDINTPGNFTGIPNSTGDNPQLYMSDAANNQWNFNNGNTFQYNSDPFQNPNPPELNNPGPVVINVGGDMLNVDVYTIKATEITVGGGMLNSDFIGENLHPSDVSFVNVAGQISYASFYTPLQTLDQAIPLVPTGDDPQSQQAWTDIFSLLVNPAVADNLTIPADTIFQPTLDSYLQVIEGLVSQQFPNQSLLFFPGASSTSTLGFVYNPPTGISKAALAFGGVMSPTQAKDLEGLNGGLDVMQLLPDGLPNIKNNQLVLDPVSFVAPSVINNLYQASLGDSANRSIGLQIGGPGQFNVTAGSLQLGNSEGIESWGIVGPQTEALSPDPFYNTLAGVTPEGATLNVTVNTGDLDMLTSRIASLGGGDVTVNCIEGGMDLGSPGLPEGNTDTAYGIYSTDGSNVKVTANNDIDIDASRIGTYNDGNVFIESYNGSVNVGSGGNTYVTVTLVSPYDLPGFSTDFLNYQIYGSGIVATSLPGDLQNPGANPLPGNITVKTPNGNITSSDAGILQLALDGSVTGGPEVDLEAGTPGVAPTAAEGNIDLGNAGLIGGTVILAAQGDINAGVIVSRQDSTVNAGQNFSGTVLAGGTATLSATAGTGTVIAMGGINSTIGSSSGLSLLSQSVSSGGGQSDTLGSSATASGTSQNAAAQANNAATQQVASNDNEDDDLNKKKKLPQVRRVGRVTLILPTATR
jgi:filamentous hemagglutinin family protein